MRLPCFYARKLAYVKKMLYLCTPNNNSQPYEAIIDYFAIIRSCS